MKVQLKTWYVRARRKCPPGAIIEVNDRAAQRLIAHGMAIVASRTAWLSWRLTTCLILSRRRRNARPARLARNARLEKESNMAGNHPAVLRLKTYIESNDVTEAQLRAASDAQWMEVMYPPDGDLGGDYMTVGIAKRYLKGWYMDRRYPGVKIELESLAAANGWVVKRIERGEGDEINIVLEKAE